MAMDILQSRKKTYHLQLFSGVEHGFALRGNMDNPYERELITHFSGEQTSADQACKVM